MCNSPCPPPGSIVALLLAIGLLAGCDTRDTDGGSTGGTTSGSPTENPGDDSGMDTGGTDTAAPPEPDGTGDPDAAEFDGSWVSDCLADPNKPLQSNAFRIETVQLTQGAYSLHYENYKDASSRLQDPVGASGGLTGTYALGDSITTTSGVSARQIDIAINETVIDGAPVSSVLDGATVLDLIAVDTDTLYMGQGIVDLKIGSRPTALNFDFAYRRQQAAQ